MGYSADRAWSDLHIDHLKQIVGPRLLVPSDFDVDTKQATDFVLLEARNWQIAARVRKPGYFDRYPYEFTVRSYRPTGVRTELEKVLHDGFGDWMFYGHHGGIASKRGRPLYVIGRWMLLDLHKFRDAVAASGGRLGQEMQNPDGTRFRAYDVRQMKQVVIASNYLCGTTD